MTGFLRVRTFAPGDAVLTAPIPGADLYATVPLRADPTFFAQVIKEMCVGSVALVISEPVNTQYRHGRPSHSYYLVICDCCVGWLSESYIRASA